FAIENSDIFNATKKIFPNGLDIACISSEKRNLTKNMGPIGLARIMSICLVSFIFDICHEIKNISNQTIAAISFGTVFVPIAIAVGLALTAAATVFNLATAIVLGIMQGVMTLCNSLYQELFCKQGRWSHKLCVEVCGEDYLSLGVVGKILSHIFALILLPITAMLRMFEINPKPFHQWSQYTGNVSTCITFSNVVDKLSNTYDPISSGDSTDSGQDPLLH
ncbi:MAG: hypothetical protein COB50_03555, partial [Thiotrichales bacterium]